MGVNGEEHDYLNRGCVPVYDKTATTCCPIEWRCREYQFNDNCISDPIINYLILLPATPGDVVKKADVLVPADFNCSFGDFTLNLLDQVTYEGGDELNCKCYIPPMVHCLKGL